MIDQGIANAIRLAQEKAEMVITSDFYKGEREGHDAPPGGNPAPGPAQAELPPKAQPANFPGELSPAAIAGIQQTFFRKPRLGEIVYAFPSEGEGFEPDLQGKGAGQPRTAIITHVHPDPKFVNLQIFEYSGRWRPYNGVPHRALFPHLRELEWEGKDHPSHLHWEYAK